MHTYINIKSVGRDTYVYIAVQETYDAYDG
jgi:hypothetical protein